MNFPLKMCSVFISHECIFKNESLLLQTQSTHANDNRGFGFIVTFCMIAIPFARLYTPSSAALRSTQFFKIQEWVSDPQGKKIKKTAIGKYMGEFLQPPIDTYYYLRKPRVLRQLRFLAHV